MMLLLKQPKLAVWLRQTPAAALPFPAHKKPRKTTGAAAGAGEHRGREGRVVDSSLAR